MGIREEIEKLKMGPPVLDYPGGEDGALVYETIRRHRNKTIEIVLSILDEHLGEPVAEYEFKAVGLLRLVLRGQTKRLIGGLTGDCVSVYVRRRDE